MTGKDKSFEELVNEAPAAPAAGTVSLVGALAQSSEPGKFVLALQDGSTVTLETAAVKGHEVLGTSVGQTIVRVDVEAEKIPPTSPTPVSEIFRKPFKDPGSDTFPPRDPPKDPWVDHKLPWQDPPKQPWVEHKEPVFDQFAPFAIATPHQVPASTLAAVQGGGIQHPQTFWYFDLGWPHHTIPRFDAGATGVPPYLD